MVEIISALIEALPLLLDFATLAYIALGIALGLGVGVIPGLGGAMTIAILLPLAFVLPFGPALGLLIGIYKGAVFGGSITAISLGIPGTAAASATVDDGYALARQGKPRKAMFTALYSSVTADTISDLVLIFGSVALASVALLFGPRGFLALFVVAFTLIALLAGNRPAKGVASAAIGLILAMIGFDPVRGTSRLTFGLTDFQSGFDLVALLIGLFAVSEMLLLLGRERRNRRQRIDTSQIAQDLRGKGADDRVTWADVRTCAKPTGIGTAIGTVIGALPGTGATLAAYLSYATAKRFSRNPDKFGKGSLEGVAAAEAGNNATCGSTLIPLLAFGIPGSEIAAMLGSALLLQGVSPGPRLFIEHREIVYFLFLILIAANVFNLFMSYFLIPVYAKLADIKPAHLIPVVFALCVLGTYSVGNNLFDVWVMLGAGVLGYGLRMMRVPLGPLILAFILAQPMEVYLRRALLIGQGRVLSLFESPIAIGLYILAALMLYLFLFRVKRAPKSG